MMDLMHQMRDDILKRCHVPYINNRILCSPVGRVHRSRNVGVERVVSIPSDPVWKFTLHFLMNLDTVSVEFLVPTGGRFSWGHTGNILSNLKSFVALVSSCL